MKLLVIFFLAVLLFNPFTMAWIASRYVTDDGLKPADAVVALRGDPPEANVRTDQAARLLAEHYAPVMLLDVSSRTFFGTREAEIVEAYLKRKGIPAQQLQLCENNADSTGEEARALRGCLKRIGARQVIVVTSEYHTRRARSTLRRQFSGSGIVIRMHPVAVPEFWDTHWWRKRRWAKTFFMETVKTIWAQFEQAACLFRQHQPDAK